MTGFRYLERRVVALRNPALAPQAVPGRGPTRRRRRTTEAQHAALARIAAAQRAKTQCPAGHEYAGENLYVRPDGRRMCRACRRAQAARLRAQTRMRSLLA